MKGSKCTYTESSAASTNDDCVISVIDDSIVTNAGLSLFAEIKKLNFASIVATNGHIFVHAIATPFAIPEPRFGQNLA